MRDHSVRLIGAQIFGAVLEAPTTHAARSSHDRWAIHISVCSRGSLTSAHEERPQRAVQRSRSYQEGLGFGMASKSEAGPDR